MGGTLVDKLSNSRLCDNGSCKAVSNVTILPSGDCISWHFHREDLDVLTCGTMPCFHVLFRSCISIDTCFIVVAKAYADHPLCRVMFVGC